MNRKSKLHSAAVLVKSLTADHAQMLLARLDPSELSRLSEAMKSYDSASEGPSSTLRRLAIREFISSVERFPAAPRTGNSGDLELPFEFLKNTTKEMRHRLLADEHPKWIAAILSNLPIQMASEILGSLDPVQRVAVLHRLCRNETIDLPELTRFAGSVKQRLKALLFRSCCASGGMETASRLLSCTDAVTRESLLESMTRDDDELAAALTSKLIGWEVLLQLSDKDLKVVLARTDTSLWAPALVHSSSKIRQRIFDNLAERPATILKRAISQSASVGVQASSTAQAAIVCQLLELADNGLIRLASAQRQAA